LEETGKKPIDEDSIAIGAFQVVIYKNYLQVHTTENVGPDTVFVACATIQEYLENVANDLDKVNKIMLQ
jgi:hypothetical protein